MYAYGRRTYHSSFTFYKSLIRDPIHDDDVSSSTIKVVQLKKQSGRAILETYGELAL